MNHQMLFLEIIVKLMILLSVFAHGTAAGLNFVVGGESGWDLDSDLETWSASQTFSVGDTLEFVILPSHSMLEVNEISYRSCTLGMKVKIVVDEIGSRPPSPIGHPSHIPLPPPPPSPIVSSPPPPVPHSSAANKKNIILITWEVWVKFDAERTTKKKSFAVYWMTEILQVSVLKVTSPKGSIGHGLHSLHSLPDHCGLKDVFKSVYREGWNECAVPRCRFRVCNKVVLDTGS
ncbi:hypothetical protein C5167_010492 [Papaver somniferum]|uniref:Phytocyanin domain-containing protein n=1 Tax=Papaver somniferum TaxID=3469 RepID=A0A4Y7K0E7_PAPSO|nr:hypothetical protein C5167_010492 [Papaver somniferum]